MAEPDYIQELKTLQHKIMTLQDSNDLQHGKRKRERVSYRRRRILITDIYSSVVEIIAVTGLYEITDATKTFDFDLCVLNGETVQRLKDFFLMRAK